MTYEHLICRLRARNALIVHFSHHSNMRAGGTFPADLHAAALNSRLWPLSCCLVWPDHSMSLPGSVGLVLRPRSLASIVGVKSADAAYSTGLTGEENGMGEALDDDSFDRSFEVAKGGYNEWRVREADVVGVYFEGEGRDLHAKKHNLFWDKDGGFPPCLDIGITPISLDEVHEAFPDLPVYTYLNGKIMATNIPASVAYPWDLTSARS